MARWWILGSSMGCAGAGDSPDADADADADADSDTDTDTDTDADADTDTDTDADADTDTDAEPRLSNLVAICDYGSYGTGDPTELGAIAEVGVAHVGQAGIGGNCCDPWIVGLVITAPFAVEIAYLQDLGADQCDCRCGWTLTYDLSPLSPGDWTIEAGGQTIGVTVP